MMMLLVSKADIAIHNRETLTKGMVGKKMSVAFGPEWDGLVKRICFDNGKSELPGVSVMESGVVEIPHEAFEIENVNLKVGFYGTTADGTLVIPTVWALLGQVEASASPNDLPAVPPTPTWTAEMEGRVNEAIKTAEDVERRANAGEFDGTDGVSPTVTVAQTPTGAKVTVTDANGTTEAELKNGTDGNDGTTPNIQIGNVETLAPGSQATATMGGTTENPLLNLGIPEGQQGKSGGISVKDAKVGQLIRAEKVDTTGNITEYEPVPFMYEDAQETVIFPEQEVSGFEDLGDGTWLVADNLGMNPETINNGDVFFVNWDGVSYKCTAVVIQNTGAVIIGNTIFIEDGENTGEPFLYTFFRGSSTWLTNQPGTSHTIGISTKVSMPVPIPPNFLGESEPVDSSILQILNGKPTWAKPILFVSFERDLNAEDVRYVADKSYEEIKNALLNDIIVIGLYRGMDYCIYYMGNFITGEDGVGMISFSYIDTFDNCIQYLIYGKTTNSWREKKLKILDSSKGLPYYDSAEDGAILQVVNGIPTWVKLTNRAEVGG